MINKEYRRFYIIALTVLLVLSAYPIINGARMAYISIVSGAIEPAQYAKYVIPYAAMCFAVILFAAFQPIIFKIRRFAFPMGLAGAYGLFIAVEQLFERIRIHTTGMSPVDTTTLSVGQVQTIPPALVDIWQASLCIASPMTRGQTVTYASQDSYLYIMANATYKIHYYLIALILLTMICGLVYGIGRMLRSVDRSKTRAIILQFISTAALVSSCVFANTTAFFRQTEAIQTPLASVLTCLFFVVLGTAVGVYFGSFFLGRSKGLRIGLPVFLSAIVVVLLYVGEAAMMEGGLYRFGRGWFFRGLAILPLAPADILVILIAGALTWLILRTALKIESWPGKRTAVVSLLVCVMIAVSGIGLSMTEGRTDVKGVSNAEDDIFGCYTFDNCLYMNPLSSFMPPVKGFMPYIYGLGKYALVIANTETGDLQQYSGRYERTPVAEDELSSKAEFIFESFPNLSQYKVRQLRAVFGQQYRLYQMDGNIWLVSLTNGILWSVYSLQKTDSTTLADLDHALEVLDRTPKWQPQMTLKDVYDLARNHESLTLRDFDRFDGKSVGTGFTMMRYDIEGGCVLIVHCDTPDSAPNFAYLSKRGYDPFDKELTVDIRAGTQAVAAYLNPLNAPTHFQIEDSHGGTGPRELIYEYSGYRYYLNTTRADQVFITFDYGERLPLKQALEERRLIIEDAVSNGLYNVFMEPIVNPVGGEFPILHHRHTFTFDNEEFYPSASFMYVVNGDSFVPYFDVKELADILTLQGRNAIAEKLRQIPSTQSLTVIAGKTYLKDADLAEAGIAVDIGWELSSHTPIHLISTSV